LGRTTLHIRIFGGKGKYDLSGGSDIVNTSGMKLQLNYLPVRELLRDGLLEMGVVIVRFWVIALRN
jgi:hypothetical protein